MASRTPTTKDFGLLYQLYKEGQINLAPEFQRNGVWPRAAKQYLIDTILAERPMPLFFFQRGRSAQSGRPTYNVIDGQQRLRAVFEYMEGRFRLPKHPLSPHAGKKYIELPPSLQDRIAQYDISVAELHGYGETEIRDMFVRINKYVVKLSPQELRHAQQEGAFYDFVEAIGKWDFWTVNRVFTPGQRNRMRQVEFAAELTILLLEGPQDKKAAVDLYYGEYRDKVPFAADVEQRLDTYMSFAAATVPDFPKSRWRKPVDLYALISALDQLSEDGTSVTKLAKRPVGLALREFEKKIRVKKPQGVAAEYALAASRQTDNLIPRQKRAELLYDLMASS